MSNLEISLKLFDLFPWFSSFILRRESDAPTFITMMLNTDLLCCQQKLETTCESESHLCDTTEPMKTTNSFDKKAGYAMKMPPKTLTVL